MPMRQDPSETRHARYDSADIPRARLDRAVAGSPPSRLTEMQTALIGSLRRLMGERNLNQLELAARSKLGSATVGRILRGDVQPRLDILEALRALFDVSPHELFMPQLSRTMSDAVRVRDVTSVSDAASALVRLEEAAKLLNEQLAKTREVVEAIRDEQDEKKRPNPKRLLELFRALKDELP